MKPDLESATSARYKIVRELGRGEQTTVELVYDEKRELLLARKTWERAGAELRFRLRQQYRRALAIAHPNLVRMYDLVIESERTALIMEAVDGRDVVAYLRELTLEAADTERYTAAVLHVLVQLFEALSALHAAGVVHRDVKPRNVLVESSGRCVLLDAGFGWPPQRHFDPAHDRVLSGVLPYLAPECLRGALPSVESDWYSFGALSFELLSAAPPFSGALERVLRDKDQPGVLRSQLTAAPAALSELVLGLLSRDPRARPNADEIWAVLEPLQRAYPFELPEQERAELSDSEPPGKPSHMQLTAAGKAALAEPRPEPIGVSEREFPAPPELEPAGEPQAELFGRDQPADLDAEIDDALDELIPYALREEVELRGLAAHGEQREHAESPSLEEEEVALRAQKSTPPEPLAHEPGERPPEPPEPTPETSAQAAEPAVLTPEHNARPVEPQLLTPEHSPQSEEPQLLTFENNARHDEFQPLAHEDNERHDESQQLVQQHSAESAEPELLTPEHNARPAESQLLAHEHSAPPVASQALTHEGSAQAVAAELDGAEAAAVAVEAIAVAAESGLDAELLRLSELALHEAGASLTCLRGAPGTGKSRLLGAMLRQLGQSARACVLTATAAPFEPLSLLRQLMSQLATQRSAALSGALRLLPATQRAALRKLCPELFAAEGPSTEAAAHDAQQQLIEALVGLRWVCLQLSAAGRLIVGIDDAHAVDADSACALRALLTAQPCPPIIWLIAQPSEQAPHEPFASLLTIAGHAPLPVRVHELDPIAARVSRTSYVPSAPAHDPPEPSTPAALTSLGPSELTHMAEVAKDTLALQASAALYRSALEREPTPDSALLQAAAKAHIAAGNLRAASQLWLRLARSTRVAAEAQHFELEAGGALLRAGDEETGRAVMRSVLRGVGLHWPRAPLLTSTLERVRVLLQSRTIHAPGHDLAARALRFDALWGVAKQLVLLSPAASDALSVRALREAVSLGDPSRLSIALGYEAISEANIGGAFLHKRAAALSGEASELAARAAYAYDLAYVRSVAAVVTWFTGDWADAESLLRDALHAYTDVHDSTAHERDVLQSFLIGALEAQGKIPQLREQLSEQRIAALVTGHRLSSMLCDLADAGLPALADDRALGAIARADALLAEHPADGFTPLHFQHFVVTTSARLYAGHDAQAYQQVEQTWQRVRHSYLPQLDAVAVMLHQLRARAALALATRSPASESERLRKQARKLATSLGHSNLAHALALRHVVDANLAVLERAPERAEQHCKRAAEIFDAADMALMREVAYHARAALVPDASAQQDGRRAAAFFASVGVRVPAAFTGAWFPTLREPLRRLGQLA